MSFITNLDIDNTRNYYAEKTDVSNDMMIDNSSVPREVSDNFGDLAAAAKQMLSRRKPIADFKTKNKSFLTLYNDLYKMGIKNNKFFLKLYDQDLVGVDVYNGIIPLDIQVKVYLECMINPWYYLREICRIPEDGSPIEVGGGSEFIIDRNSLASWYCYLNGIDHYDSKSRQTGKTQNAIAEMGYAFLFGAMSATFLFFNKDQPLAKQNLYRLKCQRDMIPTWLQMKLAYDENGGVDKGIDNITSLRNPINGNTILVMPKATSRDSAIKMGRGYTAAFHYHDEHDFTPWNTEIMGAAAYAYAKAAENSRKNGSLYSRCLTSTPGYLDTREGMDANKQISRMLKWEDKFFDIPINQLQKILKSSSYNGIMYIEHSWKQLKKSMEWYETQCRLVDYDPDKILREIDLQRIQGNERSPFKRSQLVYLAQHTREPIEELDLSNNLCPIFIYEKINPAIPYMLGVDPAEGLALNNNAFTLVNPYTLCAAAEFKSPYISPPDFVKLMIDFIDKKCPKSIFMIEANRGREIINRILETKYRHQIWYDEDKLTAKVVETADKYGAQKQAAYDRRAFGFDTTPSSRPLLFAILENFMMEQIQKIYTKFIVKDISAVQRKPDGKIILSSGDNNEEGVSHGDNLMSYLIPLFIYLNAKNLENFGIIKGQTEPKDLTPEEAIRDRKDKIKSVMNILPPEMRDLFKGVLEEKDDLTNAYDYQREIQYELQRQAIERGELTEDNAQEIDPQVIDREIFDSNFRRQKNQNNNPGYPGYPAQDPWSNGYNQGNQSSGGFDVNNWV